MKARFLFLFLGVLFALGLKAQITPGLTVTLTSAKNDSLYNITVQVLLLPDSNVVGSKLFNGKPVSFVVKSNRNYLVRVSSTSFEKTQKLVFLDDKPTSVQLFMKRKVSSLQNIVVTAKKPLLKQEDDKTIIDAEAIANTSTNAYEILEKTPGAIVDQDGNIYLNSSTPATVYINGRDMKMSADDITSLMKSLPAGSISKIEILRTPSAKYDASNSGGIVNVVLKKGIHIGTRGSINFREDQGAYATSSAGFSFNSSAGKANYYLSWQYTRRRYFEDIHSDRLLNFDTLLVQSSSTKYSPVTNYAGGGVSISLTKKLNLALDLRLSHTHNNSLATSSNLISKVAGGQALLQSNSPITNKGPTIFSGNTISAKYSIDSSGSEWVNELAYNYSVNNNSQLYTISYAQPVSPVEQGDGTVKNWSGNLGYNSDLTLKFRKGLKLESGFKLSHSVNHNEAIYFSQQGSAPRLLSSYQTNTFDYRENISAAYLQFSQPLLGFTLKAGLRLENTDISGHQRVPTDTLFSIKRTDLFPYVYLKHSLFKIMGYPLTANAVYRRSITRPGYDALSPSPKFVDQFLFDVGNTKLRPQFTTNYELNVSYNEFPVLALGINDTKDIFSRVTYQDAATKVAYRTYDNLGSNKEVYARLFGALPQDRKYFFYAGMQYNFLDYDGYYQGLPLRYKRGSWTFFTGHEYRLNNSLHVNANAWMYVNGFRFFNELKNLGQLNLSVTKLLMAKKLSVILSGNDILLTNIPDFHIQQGTVLGNGRRISDSRRIGLTLRYNFGFRQKEEKKTNFEQPAEN